MNIKLLLKKRKKNRKNIYEQKQTRSYITLNLKKEHSQFIFFRLSLLLYCPPTSTWTELLFTHFIQLHLVCAPPVLRKDGMYTRCVTYVSTQIREFYVIFILFLFPSCLLIMHVVCVHDRIYVMSR